MNFFQWCYNHIQSWSSPKWFKDFTRYILDKIIFPAILQLSEDGLILLQRLVIEASRKSISNQEKFDYVFNGFRERYGDAEKIKDSALNILINTVHAELKTKGVIK